MRRGSLLTFLLLMTGAMDIAGAEELAEAAAETGGAGQLSLVDNCFVMICAALVIATQYQQQEAWSLPDEFSHVLNSCAFKSIMHSCGSAFLCVRADKRKEKI